MDESKPLEPRQKAFVEEYLIDLNATQAAIRAGYSPNSAAVQASDLLTRPNIAAAVARAKAQRIARVNMTQDSVLHEMSLLANSRLDWFYVDDDGQVKPTSEAPEGAMGAISSIKRRVEVHPAKGDIEGWKVYHVEIRLWDKPQPLKLMGRHVGLFPDRVEHTGKGGGPIETITKIETVVVDPKAEP